MTFCITTPATPNAIIARLLPAWLHLIIYPQSEATLRARHFYNQKLIQNVQRKLYDGYN
jgi:hypothetical protein